MENIRIIAIGDNVCDKYLSRGLMYPGGQCVNTCAYAGMNGIETAYLGKFGDDEVAACLKNTLSLLNVDCSRCREYPGENGFALVTLKGNDRVFLGSNRGGVAKEHPFSFTKEDLDHIRGFQLIYTNLNAYIEDDLPLLGTLGVPIAFDFSVEDDMSYFERVCPYTTVALLSCAHLTDGQREEKMRKVAAMDVPIVIGTVGEAGSYVLYRNRFYYTEAIRADKIIDTMGAGDSYFAAFLCSLLKSSQSGALLSDDEEFNLTRIRAAMAEGAAFAARICATEGAFGYGVPITGRTTV